MKLTEKQKNELINILDGDVYFDKLARKLYSTAACIYQMEPLGVVYPRHKRDVVKTVKWAGRHSVPLTARGTGSGLAGQTVNYGVIVDFSRYMNRILEISPENDYVRVQPGLVYGKLNKELLPYGKFFPPDPASGDYCTIGGMIGNNSSGAHSVKYGATKDYIEELDIILSSGAEIKVNSQETPPVIKDIYEKVLDLLKESRALIKEKAPVVLKNSSGYNLEESLEKDRLNLTRLITGSEGTLAVVTEAKLKIMNIPEYKSTALLFFDNLEKCGKAVNITLPRHPAVIEMMDRGLIEIIRSHKPHMGSIFPPGTEASLIVEFEGNREEEVNEMMENFQKGPVKELATGIKVSTDPAEQEELWKVRKSANPLINSREDGERRPVTFIEDVSVHPAKFPEYIINLKKILNKYGLEGIIYGHAGHGNVHVRPLLNLKDPSDIEIMKKVADEIYSVVFQLKGTLSGEHGDGILRGSYLKELYGPLYDVMKKVKEIFDPLNILNPGKIISDSKIDENLKLGANFKWLIDKYPLKEDKLLLAISRCHGCGLCRTFCPVHKAVGKEIATPRAKVNWLREFIRGSISEEESFESPLAQELLSTCFNCHTCLKECPTGVDGSLIARSAKYFFRDYIDFGISDIVFQHVEFMAKGAVLSSPLSNLLINNPLIRLFSSSIGGIAKKRLLPEFQREALKSNISPGRTKTLVYFPGCYEKYYAPDSQAKAIMKVLTLNGYNVEIPELSCCEMPKISGGNWDEAGSSMVKNLKTLYSYASEGINIITGCPSCNLALKEDYPYLLKNLMAKKVAEKVIDIHEFLLELNKKEELNLNFNYSNKTFIYHSPCHLRAGSSGDKPLELLKLIPGLELAGKTDTCCGIAGSYGMKEKNFEISSRIAEETFKSVKNIQRDFSVTPCGTCKIQMKQFLGGEVFHPIEVMADSYK